MRFQVVVLKIDLDFVASVNSCCPTGSYWCLGVGGRVWGSGCTCRGSRPLPSGVLSITSLSFNCRVNRAVLTVTLNVLIPKLIHTQLHSYTHTHRNTHAHGNLHTHPCYMLHTLIQVRKIFQDFTNFLNKFVYSFC